MRAYRTRYARDVYTWLSPWHSRASLLFDDAARLATLFIVMRRIAADAPGLPKCGLVIAVWRGPLFQGEPCKMFSSRFAAKDYDYYDKS